jgi:hypothetical protein
MELPYDQLIDEFGQWVHVSYSPRHRRQTLTARLAAKLNTGRFNMLTGYRTIIAAAVALLGEILRQFDITLDAEGLTNSIMIIGGAVGAIYYRTQAKPK